MHIMLGLAMDDSYVSESAYASRRTKHTVFSNVTFEHKALRCSSVGSMQDAGDTSDENEGLRGNEAYLQDRGAQ